MKLIYQNFDTLEVSFQCAISKKVRDQLSQAKLAAQSAKNQAYAEIGPNKLAVMVNEVGAKGGYNFQFSTGADGEIWLIGDRDDRRHWNVRIKVRSLCLALNGYKKTKEKILNILLNDLSAKGPDENDGIPQERISRIDYCMDFLIQESFSPDNSNFVCCGRARKGTFGNIPFQQFSSGQAIETIMVGKMPNRQVTIYNKIREIIAKSKKYWLKIWDLEEKEIDGEIWRVEIRAGKKELNKWGLKTFDDLEAMAGNVITQTLLDFKYTIPNKSDKNQSRWPLAEIWIMAIKYSKKDLFSYTSDANRGEILKEIRETIINRYEKLISGIFVSYTAATGKDISEIPGVVDAICEQMMDDMNENPQKFIQRFKIKENQFAYLNTGS